MAHDPRTRVDRQPVHLVRFCGECFRAYLAAGGVAARWHRRTFTQIRCGRAGCKNLAEWVESKSVVREGTENPVKEE